VENKKKILIIDDNKGDYFLIKTYIKECYNTIYDNGSSDVIELMEKNEPHCILIDYHLRNKKGIDLLKQIKASKNEKIESQPIIMLTGETNPEIIIECMKHNASDYIIKGKHKKEQIKKTISQAIEKADLKKQIREQTREKKRLEILLHHNRRINSIGQLAGGIAHDFNNIIAGILGAAELLKLPERNLDKISNEYVDIIIKASNRTSSLISKLMAYGRKGKITSNVLNIDDIINDTISILKSTITDKKISILFENKAKNNKLIGDNSLLQNALMNMVINSSQAIKDGGEIKIRTKNLELNDDYCKKSPFEIKQGKYIKIEIEDIGIPVDNISKIFEPFYTTKEINKGTGLGLSAVFGTVQDHSGEITLVSEVNKGTTFTILFPCVENIKNSKILDCNNMSTDIDYDKKGKGVVLLVDDEEIIRFTGKQILKHMGYKVLVAINGENAIEVFKNHHNEIDIVIMDMLMPKLNGREAFYEIQKINKNCKVIIASGFLKDNDIEELKNIGLAGFIYKPYKSNELNKLLKEVMKDYVF